MPRKPPAVDAWLAALSVPLKPEVEAVRAIILAVDPRISEEIKWAAPTFSYKGYLVTFNLHNPKYVLLVFHNAAVLNDTSGFLTGDYPDRRLAKFHDMAEVHAKTADLVRVIRAWISHQGA